MTPSAISPPVKRMSLAVVPGLWRGGGALTRDEGATLDIEHRKAGAVDVTPVVVVIEEGGGLVAVAEVPGVQGRHGRGRSMLYLHWRQSGPQHWSGPVGVVVTSVWVVGMESPLKGILVASPPGLVPKP